MVILVNRRLFRYFGSYSGISVIPVILEIRRTQRCFCGSVWDFTLNLEQHKAGTSKSYDKLTEGTTRLFPQNVAFIYILRVCSRFGRREQFPSSYLVPKQVTHII